MQKSVVIDASTYGQIYFISVVYSWPVFIPSGFHPAWNDERIPHPLMAQLNCIQEMWLF